VEWSSIYLEKGLEISTEHQQAIKRDKSQSFQPALWSSLSEGKLLVLFLIY